MLVPQKESLIVLLSIITTVTLQIPYSDLAIIMVSDIPVSKELCHPINSTDLQKLRYYF